MNLDLNALEAAGKAVQDFYFCDHPDADWDTGIPRVAIEAYIAALLLDAPSDTQINVHHARVKVLTDHPCLTVKAGDEQVNGGAKKVNIVGNGAALDITIEWRNGCVWSVSPLTPEDTVRYDFVNVPKGKRDYEPAPQTWMWNEAIQGWQFVAKA